jgi:hypothetical protein
MQDLYEGYYKTIIIQSIKATRNSQIHHIHGWSTHHCEDVNLPPD